MLHSTKRKHAIDKGIYDKVNTKQELIVTKSNVSRS